MVSGSKALKNWDQLAASVLDIDDVLSHVRTTIDVWMSWTDINYFKLGKKTYLLIDVYFIFTAKITHPKYAFVLRQIFSRRAFKCYIQFASSCCCNIVVRRDLKKYNQNC